MQESSDSLPPGKRRVLHQLTGIGQNPGLLKIESLYNEVLLGRKEGIKEGPGNTDLL